MTLHSRIRQSERSIAQRRNRLGVAVDGVTHAVRRRMVSPGVLVTAGLLGAALQRGHRLHGLRLLALIEAANAGLRLLRQVPELRFRLSSGRKSGTGAMHESRV